MLLKGGLVISADPLLTFCPSNADVLLELFLIDCCNSFRVLFPEGAKGRDI